MSDNNRAEAHALQAMRDYRNAVDPDVDSDKDPDELLNRIEAALDAVDEETRNRLEAAMGDIENQLAERAFQAYGEIADRIRSTKEGFKLGQHMADEGENDLFFPAAATHLAQVAGLLTELKEAAETVKGGIDDLAAAFKKGDVEGLIAEGGAIKETIEALLGEFEEIKENLP